MIILSVISSRIVLRINARNPNPMNKMRSIMNIEVSRVIRIRISE